jgi:diaminopimelate epimerase
MSGNGIRCLGQAVARQHGLTEGPITALTDAGVRPLQISAGTDAASVMVSVGMGEPGPGPHIPEPVHEFLSGRFATVDMGNPHLVVVVDDPAEIDLMTEGSWLEQQFPAGMNIEYIAPAGDGSGLVLRVWERGAGVTDACGTGACAAAHQARSWGLVGDRVTVSMPGGDAVVVLEEDATATLIGPSVHIADVIVDAADLPASNTTQDATVLVPADR